MSTKNGTYETCASLFQPEHSISNSQNKEYGHVASEITSYNHKRHQDIIRCSPYYTVRRDKGGQKKILEFYGRRQPHHMAESKNFHKKSVNTFLCNFYIYYQI